ncbi:uncharacterized protein DS421_5g152450 [Arachis hypogaea]|nr:uncharacterized protein DS421_5g152450 [Arachis hypogaea]
MPSILSLAQLFACLRCHQTLTPFSTLATPKCPLQGCLGVAFNNSPFLQVGNADNFSSSYPVCFILASMLSCFITYHQQGK